MITISDRYSAPPLPQHAAQDQSSIKSPSFPWPVWRWGEWETTIHISSASRVCRGLLAVAHPWGGTSTRSHCPSIFPFDGLDVELPLACPGAQYCTGSRARWRNQASFRCLMVARVDLVSQQVLLSCISCNGALVLSSKCGAVSVDTCVYPAVCFRAKSPGLAAVLYTMMETTRDLYSMCLVGKLKELLVNNLSSLSMAAVDMVMLFRTSVALVSS